MATGNISNDLDFGENCLTVLERRDPNLDKFDDKEIERRGMRMLDEYFDELRRKWAKDWFYFGCNPNEKSTKMLYLASKIEREI